jgi:hypothetical protein
VGVGALGVMVGVRFKTYRLLFELRKREAMVAAIRQVVGLQKTHAENQQDLWIVLSAWAQEQRARASDDRIRGTQVGARLRPRSRMMPDQRGFGDNGTESTRPCQSAQGDDQMNEYDSEVAHPGNGINTSKTTALRIHLAIRHRQDLCMKSFQITAGPDSNQCIRRLRLQ